MWALIAVCAQPGAGTKSDQEAWEIIFSSTQNSPVSLVQSIFPSTPNGPNPADAPELLRTILPFLTTKSVKVHPNGTERFSHPCCSRREGRWISSIMSYLTEDWAMPGTQRSDRVGLHPGWAQKLTEVL